MKKVSELVKNPGGSIQPESSATSTSVSKRSELMTLYVLKRLSMIWKSKFTDQFNTDGDIGNAIQEWIGSVSQLDCGEIKQGIEGCKGKYAWPPEISEFLAEANISKREGCHKFMLPEPEYKKASEEVVNRFSQQFKSQIIEARVKSSVKDSLNTFYKGDDYE